ncbi:hypothetical protein ACFQ9Y_16995 [Peribacillus simplex]|uniref:hypothetical protein n=1 Tax=Peribacillus simplex TaxID=1478 RepID=UPI0036708FEC
MSEFNPEFIKALAHGDTEAHEQLRSLPLTVRMALGTAIDQLRRDENIIPMNGGMSIYEQKKSSYVDDDAVGKALAERIQREKDAKELQERIREEQMEKEVRYNVSRARAGLPY